MRRTSGERLAADLPRDVVQDAIDTQALVMVSQIDELIGGLRGARRLLKENRARYASQDLARAHERLAEITGRAAIIDELCRLSEGEM